MTAIDDFQIEDIDGCEFVKNVAVGKMLISFHRDFDGYCTGLIHVVYPDGSQKNVSHEEAQKNIDEGLWKVLR